MIYNLIFKFNCFLKINFINLLIGCIICFGLTTGCKPKKPEIIRNSILETTVQTQKLSIEPVKVGILNIDSAVFVHERYIQLLDYLSEKTGRPFKLVILSQESQFTEVAAENLDFILSNPVAAVQIHRLYQTKFLTTQFRPKTGSKFSGLIVVKNDSNIKTLADLRGKKVACVNFQAEAGGCIFQIDHLLKSDIDPFKDFGNFVENPSQDNIVLGIINGKYDAGFIQTGQLEKMLSKGLINSINELRVLNPAEDNFYHLHTTALYPEWQFAALKNTDPELVITVTEIMLNMPPNHPALVAAGLEKFIPATDYSEIDRLIESLKLKSWNSHP